MWMIVIDVKVVQSARIGLSSIGCSDLGLYTSTVVSSCSASKRSHLIGERGTFDRSRYFNPSVVGEDTCMAFNSNATTFLNAMMNL